MSKTLGEIAFNAYNQIRGGVTHDGKPRLTFGVGRQGQLAGGRGMNLKVTVERDEDAENPRTERSGDGSLFLAWHKRYRIGDPKPARRFEHPESEFPSRDDLLAALREELSPIAELPVFMYEHGGQAYSTESFADPWDSGQLGWIFAVPNERWQGMEPEQIAEALRAEIAEYHAWTNGEVYAYRVTNDEGETLEAGGGYYSEDDCREAAEEARRELLAAEASEDAAL